MLRALFSRLPLMLRTRSLDRKKRETHMTPWLSQTMVVLLLSSAPFGALAQAPTTDGTPVQQAPGAQQAPVAAPRPPAADQAQVASDKPLLRSVELDQLLAPIALYPDPLLSNVLIASTYPLEVVQADRWLQQNKSLQGDQLAAAASKQSWDDSLKALVATPSVLDMMSKQLDWTQRLGDAVLAQQQDVMDAVQRLRARAQANNKLTTTKQQKVTVRQEQNRQFIAIEPTTADTLYVPYYDPAVAYGEWPDPAYPPYYWGYPGYIASGVIATGLAFGAAYGIARWVGYWNGGGFAWGRGNIVAGGGRVEHWQHNAQHRRGVGYTNANVRQQFGAANARAGNAARQNRGAGNTSRATAGQGTANRAGAGQGAANRAAGKNQTQARKAGGKNQARARNTGARRDAGRGAGKNAGVRQANRTAGARGGRQAQARPAARTHGGGQRAGAGRPRQASMAGRGMGGRGAHAAFRGGGRSFARGGGGGFRGGRRSDVAFKRDIALLGYLDNGLGFYRFRYLDGKRVYVGVMAQEVQAVMPEAVRPGRDGYLSVSYPALGLKFQSYDQWLAAGARIPIATHIDRRQ